MGDDTSRTQLPHSSGLALALLLALLFSPPLRAAEADQTGRTRATELELARDHEPEGDDADLADLDLEALMEIEVTSVSKRAQKWFETPAAVTRLPSRT